MSLSTHVPDLTSLELLLAVGHTGGLSAAGRELGLTQQAVSARIRSMERRVGMRLLHRGPRGSTLTPAGRQLAQQATELISAAQKLEDCITTLRDNRQGLDSPRRHKH